MNNFNNMIKQAQELQQKMADAQQKVETLEAEGVAGGGIVTGSALVGKRPFYIIRYQGYNWFNCTFIINYACKSKEIWKIPCPIFIRGISSEGSIGPVAGSSHLSIFYKMPGIKIFSPMTNNEYKKVYKALQAISQEKKLLLRSL